MSSQQQCEPNEVGILIQSDDHVASTQNMGFGCIMLISLGKGNQFVSKPVSPVQTGHSILAIDPSNPKISTVFVWLHDTTAELQTLNFVNHEWRGILAKERFPRAKLAPKPLLLHFSMPELHDNIVDPLLSSGTAPA